MNTLQNRHRTLAALALGVFLQMTVLPARAADRPFLSVDTAMVEDDDERTFEFSTWLVKLKQERAVQAALEYNLNPTLSAELELGWSKNKLLDSTERSLELGVRNVWIDPARQGWGLGSNLSVGWVRRDDMGWKAQSLRALATYSLPMLENQIWLHANAGLERDLEERSTQGVWSMGVQGRVRKDITLFAEYARQANKDSLVDGGVRWWAKKEKVALDFSIGRVRPRDDEGQKFITLGLSFYDLDFK
jgi:hypothetical protein